MRERRLRSCRGFLRTSVMLGVRAFLHDSVDELSVWHRENPSPQASQMDKTDAGPDARRNSLVARFCGGYQGTYLSTADVVIIHVSLLCPDLPETYGVCFAGSSREQGRSVLGSAKRYEFRCARRFLYFVDRPQFKSALRGDVKPTEPCAANPPERGHGPDLQNESATPGALPAEGSTRGHRRPDTGMILSESIRRPD